MASSKKSLKFTKKNTILKIEKDKNKQNTNPFLKPIDISNDSENDIIQIVVSTDMFYIPNGMGA
jgi:hypothetical protein